MRHFFELFSVALLLLVAALVTPAILETSAGTPGFTALIVDAFVK